VLAAFSRLSFTGHEVSGIVRACLIERVDALISQRQTTLITLSAVAAGVPLEVVQARAIQDPS
jgi:hypothetical protein